MLRAASVFGLESGFNRLPGNDYRRPVNPVEGAGLSFLSLHFGENTCTKRRQCVGFSKERSFGSISKVVNGLLPTRSWRYWEIINLMNRVSSHYHADDFRMDGRGCNLHRILVLYRDIFTRCIDLVITDGNSHTIFWRYTLGKFV